MDVDRAVLLEITTPPLGFIKPIVEVPFADPDPIKISVIINNIFFSFNDLYFFFIDSLSFLRDFNIFY